MKHSKEIEYSKENPYVDKNGNIKKGFDMFDALEWEMEKDKERVSKLPKEEQERIAKRQRHMLDKMQSSVR